MERESICLFDSDPLFGRMILQAIQEAGVLPGNYTYYSELESVCQHVTENRNSVLLLQKEREEEFNTMLKEIGLEEAHLSEIQDGTLLLSAVPVENGGNELYKYLPRSQFIDRLGVWCKDHGARRRNKEIQHVVDRNVQMLTGFVSFAGTGFEYYLSRLVQENPQDLRLVVNFELFPYSKPHDRPRRDLSDLIYYASIDRLSKIDMKECIYHVDGVDYIEPITHYKDGYELDENVAERLLTILQTQPYNHIILITDCRYRGASRLLELCHEVEIEETDNPILRQKYTTMVQMLHLEQRETLLSKLKVGSKEVSYGAGGAI